MDYPTIELHPFDTRKFSIQYNDTADDSSGSALDQFSVNLQKSGKKLDLRTLSRESRDLICLTIKSFAAQSYFINSKVMNHIEDQDQCEVITRNSQYPSNWFGTKSKAEKDEHQYQLSDVLLELEFVKHDLNLQISSVKTQEKETARYKKQFHELEEEMATTIASYQNIIA